MPGPAETRFGEKGLTGRRAGFPRRLGTMPLPQQAWVELVLGEAQVDCDLITGVQALQGLGCKPQLHGGAFLDFNGEQPVGAIDARHGSTDLMLALKPLWSLSLGEVVRACALFVAGTLCSRLRVRSHACFSCAALLSRNDGGRPRNNDRDRDGERGPEHLAHGNSLRSMCW